MPKRRPGEKQRVLQLKEDLKSKQQHASYERIHKKIRPSSERILEHVLGSFTVVKDIGYWKPTGELAEFLDVPYVKLNLGPPPNSAKKVVCVWSTVVTMTYCYTYLYTLREYWYGMAEKARCWLYTQPDFIGGKASLVQTVCELVGGKSDELLQEMFGKKNIASAIAEYVPVEESGDYYDPNSWIELFMDDPPYSMYYENKFTYETRWTIPTGDSEDEVIETQPAIEEEVVPKKVYVDVSQFRLDKKVIPKYVAPPAGRCQAQGCKGKNKAKILCMACKAVEETVNASWNWNKKTEKVETDVLGLYLCEPCCDAIHYEPETFQHVVNGQYRFLSCYGRKGFPHTKIKV